MARKIKIELGYCVGTSTYSINCNVTDSDVAKAQEVLDDWLLEYIAFMKTWTSAHGSNGNNKLEIQFWTPVSLYFFFLIFFLFF